MRLIQIKLAGFKSFVDPTTIKIPGKMIGVVGPNGCGKSNIIDAVRWVLGESRASELRGESMHDVIFKGSEQRSPAARASVELVFDNSEQRVPGQWGAYAELAVRRTLARDEGSRYYLNNQQVRRRDIYDIFMGTGLGSRGYAIIGQGMINRLIEARPEELRVYLEEAAGVSRYKERRRETENRLKDTQDNLSRLEDLLHEIEQQLQRLKRQAAQAQRYQQLQDQGLKTQHALWRLAHKQAASSQQEQALALEKLELSVQKQLAELRGLQAQLETQRVHHQQATDAVQTTQNVLYEANARVSTAQAELRYVQANQERSVKRRSQIEQQLSHWQQQQEQATEQKQQLQEQYEQGLLSLEEAEAQLEGAELRLEELEQELLQSSQLRDELRQQLQRDEQEIALLQQRDQDAHSQLLQLQQRAQQLREQHGELFTQQPEDDLVAMSGAIEHAKAQLQAAHAQLQHWEAQLPERQQKLAGTEQQWHQQQTSQVALAERIQALEEIQQQWASPAQLQQWLEEQQLTQVPRLWPELQVESGWEVAAEAILREQVGAFLLAEEQLALLTQIDLHPPRRVHLWPTNRGSAQRPQSWQGCTPLSQYVQGKQPKAQALLNHLLAQVWVVQDWAQGLALSKSLPQGGYLVHPQGHVFYSTGISIYAPEDEEAGGVARQQELAQLYQRTKQEKFHAQQLEQQLTLHREAVQEAENTLQKVRTRVHELSTYLHELEMNYTQARQRSQQQRERQEFIATELTQVTERMQALEHTRAQSMAQLDTLEAIVEEQRARFVDSDDVCVQLGEQVQSLRRQLRDFERATHHGQQKQNTLQERISSLTQIQAQAEAQYETLHQEHQQLQNELISFDAQAVQQELDEALTARQISEQHWQRAQEQLKEQQNTLQKLQEKEQECARGIGPIREQIASIRLKEQEGRLKTEQYGQQLTEHEVDIEALDRFIAEQSEHWQDKTWLNEEVKRIQRAIKAMGAVNLAALEELKAAEERQKYLLAQQEDLLSAIDTLDSAIRKIDRQTRALLQETFEAVDQNFGALFPQLFGGGEAKLVMQGEEILEAGVQVMARPPGKRNSTIALLSGGEKALTATALVFAFFKLNPAPFCLLDEVDAPLDDANAERYAQLVQGMSDNTQFLFVTHNKITMQQAEQLIGVTMQEQGVSRIVSVDMQAATELVEA